MVTQKKLQTSDGETVSDFADPLNPAEMNGFTHTPSSVSDSDPNLDYKPEMLLEFKPGHFDPHYENLPQRPNVTVSNTISSPASPSPGHDELEFLPHNYNNYKCMDGHMTGKQFSNKQ